MWIVIIHNKEVDTGVRILQVIISLEFNLKIIEFCLIDSVNFGMHELSLTDKEIN